MPALPDTLSPMLAKPGSPFDSDEHLFEIKWDGTRALGFVEGGAHTLRNRYGKDIAPLFPELDFLAELPSGLLLDGEIVVLKDGKVDFGLAMSRVHARGNLRIESLARSTPATYVVFDLLYRAGESLLEQPLRERRSQLEEAVGVAGRPELVFSDGIAGAGQAYYDKVCGLGFEGVVAKRLDGRYEAGRRTGSWTKCKRIQHLACAIVGYVPDGEDDLKSLAIAADFGGELCCVGKVGSGLSTVQRKDLARELGSRLRDEPIVDCGFPARWVEPGLYCTVSFLERTEAGHLRAPVFVGMIQEA
jgi:DNA ligase D-like protein (predicted ligase)